MSNPHVIPEPLPDNDPETNVFDPDYSCKCENCEQVPTVRIRDKDGKLISHFGMCGPCTFGEAACIDPDNW